MTQPVPTSSRPQRRRTHRFRFGPHSFAILLTLAIVGGGGFVVPAPAAAQLPAEAVDLALVKIAEVQKSEDLCPVELVPSVADGETWTHEGVTYRGSRPGVREQFEQDPSRYVEPHRRERWIHNFMTAMSTIWCPITDEVTPGGRMRLDAHGYTWESCCSFCDEDMSPDNVVEALERLQERAAEAYELTRGVYHEGASSPVEGAIRDDV